MRSSAARWLDRARGNPLAATSAIALPLLVVVLGPVDLFAPGALPFVTELVAFLLLAAMLWSLPWRLGRAEVGRFLRAGANLPVLLFLLALCAVAVTHHARPALQELARLGAGIALFFVVSYRLRRSEYLNNLVDCILASVFVVAAVAAAQIALETEITGPFHDATLLGSWLSLMVPILGAVVVLHPSAGRRTAAEVAGVLAGAGLLLSGDKGACWAASAGLLAAGALCLYAVLRRPSTASREREVMLACAVIVVAIGAMVASATVDVRAARSTTAEARVDPRYGIGARGNAAAVLRLHPLAGVGLGQYRYAPQDGQRQRADGEQAPSRNGLNEQAHSLYLQTAAEMGLLGLAFFCAVPLTLIAGGLRRIGRMDAGVRQMLLAGSVAAIVGFVVDAATSPAWQYAAASTPLWIMFGLASGMLRPHVRSSQEPAPGGMPAAVSRAVVVAGFLAAALLLPTVDVAPSDQGYAVEGKTSAAAEGSQANSQGLAQGPAGGDTGRTQGSGGDEGTTARAAGAATPAAPRPRSR